MQKQNLIYTKKEYYAVLKRKDIEILTQSAMLMSLEEMMLTEISQSLKGKYSLIPLMRYIEWSHSQRQKAEW